MVHRYPSKRARTFQPSIGQIGNTSKLKIEPAGTTAFGAEASSDAHSRGWSASAGSPSDAGIPEFAGRQRILTDMWIIPMRLTRTQRVRGGVSNPSAGSGAASKPSPSPLNLI
jgi:hypothetical protein